MPKHVLITGASGLIGTRLTKLLIERGHTVAHLGRSRKEGSIPSYVWDIKNRTIEDEALKRVNTIVHLAGAGVADKRWNEDRKKEILDSRTLSTRLLYEKLATTNHRVTAVISASAVGYYGFTAGSELFTESHKPGQDFLADVVRAWEAEVDTIGTLDIRVAKIRIGIVLSNGGGALAQMITPVKWFVGSPLASGNQYMSWIHIDDLCGIFLKAIEDDDVRGAYNGVAPNPVTNASFTRVLAEVMQRPLWAPNVPAFALRLLVGEMADIVVYGNNVSADKIAQAGYSFQYPQLKQALKDLVG